MTSTEIKKLLKLPKNQKIKLVQTIWDDIARESEEEPVSKEHIKILKQRISRIEGGKTKFKDWDTLKKKYQFNAFV